MPLLIALPILRAPGWPIEPGLYELLLLVGGTVILIGAVLLSIQRGRPFSAALVYLAAGVAIGLLLRAIGVAWYDPIEDAALFSRAAELAVIVSLFGAGVKLDRALTLRGWRTPILLLAVAMPLTIIGVALLGTWLVGMSVAGAILLGAVLAPTDPVLADDIQVGGPMEREPEDEARFALTAEAGLNDALAFPFVNAAIAMLAGGAWFGGWLLDDVFIKLGVGLASGLLFGRLLGWLVFVHLGGEWKAQRSEAIAAIGATLLVYGATELANGYGFLAVFVAAVTLRSSERDHEFHEPLHAAAESVENLGSALVMVLIGGSIVDGALAPLGWREALVGVAIVALVRPVTCWLSLLGTHLDRRQRLVTSAFGIRGVGSVYYLAYAGTHADVPGIDRLWAITVFVICLSLVVHGAFAKRAVEFATADEQAQLQLFEIDERT